MIHFIALKEITIPANRQRQEFEGDAMAELSDSIASVGLLHPLILDSNGELRTGERRYRALKNLYMMGLIVKFNQKEIPLNTAPCLIYEELSDIEKMEIEYDENHKRKDLTWQESAKATALLAKLKGAKASEAGLPIPSISEISTDIRGSGDGSYREATRRELIVSQHLDDPEVAKAKTVDDAFKVLKKREEVRRNETHAELVGKTYSNASHKALNEDAAAWLGNCPAEQFDLILTDPPYGMGADGFGDSGTQTDTAHHYSDKWEDVAPLLHTIIEQGFRVTKPQAHLYMFCDIDHFHELREAATAAGWWAFRTPLIWNKMNGLRAPWPENGPRRVYECILYAVKGKKIVTSIQPDVLSWVPVGGESLYQAQKPVGLFAELIKRSCRAGERILDPCMGSGTIFEAASQQKCIATGIELLAEPFGIAVQRLEKLK